MNGIGDQHFIIHFSESSKNFFERLFFPKADQKYFECLKGICGKVLVGTQAI